MVEGRRTEKYRDVCFVVCVESERDGSEIDRSVCVCVNMCVCVSEREREVCVNRLKVGVHKRALIVNRSP